MPTEYTEGPNENGRKAHPPKTKGAANTTMEVEIVEHEEDSASAGRGEGGADGRAHARPSGGDGRA